MREIICGHACVAGAKIGLIIKASNHIMNKASPTMKLYNLIFRGGRLKNVASCGQSDHE